VVQVELFALVECRRRAGEAVERNDPHAKILRGAALENPRGLSHTKWAGDPYPRIGWLARSGGRPRLASQLDMSPVVDLFTAEVSESFGAQPSRQEATAAFARPRSGRRARPGGARPADWTRGAGRFRRNPQRDVGRARRVERGVVDRAVRIREARI
jgi:hypothetical protein